MFRGPFRYVYRRISSIIYIYTHVYVSYHILYNYISYIIYPVTHQSVYAFSPITLFCGGSPTVSTCTEASLCAFVVGCAWVPSLGCRALLSGAVAPLVQPLLPLPAAAGVALPWHDGMRGSFMRMMCLSSSVFFYIPNTHSGSKCGLSGVVWKSTVLCILKDSVNCGIKHDD